MYKNIFIDSVFKSVASDWCYCKHAILVLFVFMLCALHNLSVLLCTGVHSQMYMYIASLHHIDQSYLLQKNGEIVEAYRYDSAPSIFSFCYRHTYKPSPTALTPTARLPSHTCIHTADWLIGVCTIESMCVCVCVYPLQRQPAIADNSSGVITGTG